MRSLPPRFIPHVTLRQTTSTSRTMVLVNAHRMSPNPTLKGHKLLVQKLTGWTVPEKSLKDLQTRFPDLKISTGDKQDRTQSSWDDVTILLTGHNRDGLPPVQDVPKLQYIQLSSAGANLVVDDPLFTDTDVAFCTANGVHGPQISEWIISTFLLFQHHIPYYWDLQREAKWNKSTAPTEDAVSRRVGILGYGSIGRQTARVATAMGMEVYAYTLHPRNTPESKRDESYTPPGLGDPEGIYPTKWFSGGSKEDLHSFIGAGLDLLVVALPLTEKTKGLVSAPEFKVLSEKKTFVSNIARGPIIDTDDLIEALDKELIRGAALDVTDPEPLTDGHPLWSAKNVLITPHISGASTSYFDRVWAILTYNLQRLSEGKKLTNVVNRKEGY